MAPYVSFHAMGREFPGIFSILAAAEAMTRLEPSVVYGVVVQADGGKWFDRIGVVHRPKGGGVEIEGLEPADAPAEGGGS